MTKRPAPDEWNQLIIKMGELTVAAGSLEAAIISMVCHILGKSEKEIARLSNKGWCDKFIRHAPSSWTETQRKDLSERIKVIRNLYLRRNDLIHAALRIVTDEHIHGIPPGSIIDVRTYGFGCTKQEGNKFAFGWLAKRVNLDEIDRLVDDLHNARIGLVPFMELVENIPQPAKPISALKLKPGRLWSECD